MGKKANKTKKDNSPYAEDITDEFFHKCSLITEHQVVSSNNRCFEVAEASQIIELMDEKNDVGIHQSHCKFSIDSLIKKGFFSSLSSKQVLAMIDRTFAMYVSYLLGGQCEATIYTNILLLDPTKNIPEKALGVFCKAFSYLIPLTEAIMIASGVVQQEDFSFSNSNLMRPAGDWIDIRKMVQSVENEYLNKASKLQTLRSEDESYCRAISERLQFLRLFIEMLDVTLPPLDLRTMELSTADFSPKISLAINFLDELRSLCSNLCVTFMNPQFHPIYYKYDSWKDIFIMGINMRCLTGSIPRKNVLFSLFETFDYLSNTINMVHNVLKTVEPSLTYILNSCETRVHSMNPNFLKRCTLYRAYIQIFIRPDRSGRILHQNHRMPLLQRSLLFGYCNYLEYKFLLECPHFLEFMNQAKECILEMVFIYSHNWSRQHQKLPNHIENWVKLMEGAKKLDIEWEKALGKKQYVSVTDIIQSFIEDLTKRHFELTFSLKLLNPYEMECMFWFYNEAIGKTRRNTHNRIVHGLLSSRLFGKNKNITTEDHGASEKMYQRFYYSSNVVKQSEIDNYLCNGTACLGAALRRLKSLPVLECSYTTQLGIFERRKSVYTWLKKLNDDIDVSIESWKDELMVMDNREIRKLWADAHHFFNEAFLKIRDANDFPMKQRLEEIARHNTAACQIMLNKDNWKRKVELIILLPFDRFPTLKIPLET